jgi:hypothetical protein
MKSKDPYCGVWPVPKFPTDPACPVRVVGTANLRASRALRTKIRLEGRVLF